MRGKLTALTILTLLLVPSFAFGQIKLQKARFGQQGKFHIGNQIFLYESFSEKATEPEEGDEVDSSTLNIQPFIGYFVTPGLEIAALIDYRSDSFDDGDSTSSAFGLGPRLAYYHKISPILHIYARGWFKYFLSISQEVDGEEVDGDFGAYEYAAGAGVAIPIGHKVGGVLTIGGDYVMQNRSFKPDGADDEFVTENAGFRLATGISLYF